MGWVSTKTPVPLSETLLGDEAALLGMDTEPVLAVAEVGEKVTSNVQVPAGAIVALLQVLLLMAKSPLTLSMPIIKLAVPVLVKVKDLAALVAPVF